MPLADLGGACPAHAPYGSRLFRFDIKDFCNVAASGVHNPLTRSTPPPTGNPGSATACCQCLQQFVDIINLASTMQSSL